jgi:N-acylneuraminate cytidylyltransferase
MKKIVAIIPARGGSKRIPKKNIKAFCGKPMIGWPIDALRASDLVSDVIVSTDSEEIKEVAEAYGARVPFVRPAALADDFTGTADVTKHAAQWYCDNVGKPDLFLTVYPTAVFLSADDLGKAVDRMTETNAEIVFSAAEFPFPIQRAVFLDGDDRALMFQPEHYYTRSQDLPKAYQDAGQFYLARAETALLAKPTFGPHTTMLVLPRHRVVDIDTMEDFEIAERLFRCSRSQFR